jgi:tellurite methyltransferase
MGEPIDLAAYFRSTLAMPLHPIFRELDPYIPASGVAIDLGCGVGTGTLHLLERGLSVVAVDSESEALEMMAERLPEGADVAVLQSRFQDLRLLPDTYDVAVAVFSLYFLPPEEFGQFWPRLVAAIKPGGLFAGQFLGVNDEWGDQGFSLHSRSDVEALLAPFEILHLEEVERDGKTSWGEPKHWHVFHTVARRKTQP